MHPSYFFFNCFQTAISHTQHHWLSEAGAASQPKTLPALSILQQVLTAEDNLRQCSAGRLWSGRQIQG